MKTTAVEETIEIGAPVARVWRAIKDSREFGAWFHVALQGPFVPGRAIYGNVTYPGAEHLKFEAMVKEMEHEKKFSFTWHPFAIDPKKDYSKETPTLVTFILEAVPNGTLLRVTETGFENLPAERRDEALRKQQGGWAIQLKNVEAHIAKKP